MFLSQPTHSSASMNDKLFDQLVNNKKFNEVTFDTCNYVLDKIKQEVQDEPEINK